MTNILAYQGEGKPKGCKEKEVIEGRRGWGLKNKDQHEDMKRYLTSLWFGDKDLWNFDTFCNQEIKLPLFVERKQVKHQPTSLKRSSRPKLTQLRLTPEESPTRKSFGKNNPLLLKGLSSLKNRTLE